MKYPFVIFFRHKKYSHIDSIFKNKDEVDCTLFITDNKEELYKLFDPTYQILVTFGPEECEYIEICNSLIAPRMRKRWIHYKEISCVKEFCRGVNYCFVDNCSLNREEIRPTFSIFTTTYNSYDKIIRAYNSLKSQKFNDWEWVIVDDSPDDNHFSFLKNLLQYDYKIRLYRRSKNSGNIGNVKNESIGLCRGKYIIEFDHDDEIPETVLQESATYFDKNPDVGFIYMDFINILEDGKNFRYGDFIGKGYSSYYCQKFKGVWRYVYITANVNNVTLSHLVCMPNHPRIWRRDVLIKAGSYCEMLPINDDQEILMRTALITKMAKIHKIGYIQYMNNNGNNFSLIRNWEINRIGPFFLQPVFYQKHNMNEEMKKLDAYEDTQYIYNDSKIWERDENTYIHKFCNNIVNLDFDKQYCIVGIDTFMKNLDKMRELSKNSRNDFILLDNSMPVENIWTLLDNYNLDHFKCYSLLTNTKQQLINFFMLMYKSCDDYEIISE
jgi:glycosyltransferase involved in cell wall biosynthesis